MPKAVDRYPQSRGVGNSLYNPLRSGIQGWTDPLGAIDEAAERAGQGIRQRLEDGLDQVLDGVVDTIFNVTGIDLSGPVELLEQLLGVPLAFLDSASLGTAIDVLGQFFPFLAGANADDFDPLEAAAAFINARLSPTGLLASWSALYHEITGEVDGALDDLGELLQHGLFGQIAAGRLGQISAASIDNLNPETLDNPGFDTDASIRDNSEVEWDGTFGRTRPGSMKIVADGTTKTAVSNPLRVVQNREVNVSIWTYYTGVTANPGTTPIRLSVAAYADAPVASDPPVWIADTLIPATAIASPAGDSSDVAGNVDGWVLISGSYTVPAGVDLIVNKVQVTDDCLAGEVHFDDGSRKRAGMLPKEYVEGLIAELTEHAEKIRQTINKAWEALTDLPATVDKTVDDLKNALKSIPQGNIQNFAAALNGAGQDIRDAIVNALGGTGTGHNAAAVIAALQNIPQDAIDGLEDELADAGDAIADVFDDVRDTWNGFWGKVFGSSGATNKTAADFQDAAQTMIDFIRQGADGTAQDGAPMVDAKAALEGLREATIAANKALAEILANQTANEGIVGNRYSDSAGRETTDGWGSNWLLSGEGSTHCDGNNFVWDDAGITARRILGRYLGGGTVSDYQRVQIVLASAMEKPIPFSNIGDLCGNAVLARVNNAGNTFVYALFYWDSVEIGCFNNGVRTTFGVYDIPPKLYPAAGAILSLDAGTGEHARQFVARVNGSSVAAHTDTAGVSQMGSGYRSGGQAMWSAARGTGESTPGSVGLWSLSDNMPLGSNVTGIGMVAYRTTGSGTIGTSGSGDQFFGNNGFTAVEFITSGVTWTQSSASIQFAQAGWYNIKFRVGIDGTALLYRNGVLYKRGPRNTGSGASIGLMGDFTVYSTPTDVWRLGANTSGAQGSPGDADGANNWVTALKVG
ncbi:DUF7257 domain-containing protein [Mycolicibacterium goodii]|uniref:DUF7257 domain-containing protein n=1 Tax=Mycolicibacterium goodii TaxID=134601 RepID=UPI001BDD6051|nr:apolipoprotein A1/A4/E family protein [Mycolicibacterium goodii]MBU8831480.1 apolipoprotein A1/A4/E family protein [Mycolicibacterium goodii]